MPFATFDERAYPLVLVTISERPSREAWDAFLDYARDLLDRPERQALVVHVENPRIWHFDLSDRHEDLFEDLFEEVQHRLAALAYVVKAQFVAVALDFAAQRVRVPFPVRVFDDNGEAKAWAQQQLGTA